MYYFWVYCIFAPRTHQSCTGQIPPLCAFKVWVKDKSLMEHFNKIINKLQMMSELSGIKAFSDSSLGRTELCEVHQLARAAAG